MVSLLFAVSGCDISGGQTGQSVSVYVEKQSGLVQVDQATVYVRDNDGRESSKNLTFSAGLGAVQFTSLESGEVEVHLEILGVGTDWVRVQLFQNRSVAVRFYVYAQNGSLVIDGSADYPGSMYAANYIDSFDAARLNLYNADSPQYNDLTEMEESMSLVARGWFPDPSTIIFSGPDLYLSFSQGSRGLSLVTEDDRIAIFLQDQADTGIYAVAVGDVNGIFTDREDTVILDESPVPYLFIDSYPGFFQVPDADNAVIAGASASAGFTLSVTVQHSDVNALSYALILVHQQQLYADYQLMSAPASAGVPVTWSWANTNFLSDGLYRAYAIASDSDLSWLLVNPPHLDSADPFSVLGAVSSDESDTDLVMAHYFLLGLQP